MSLDHGNAMVIGANLLSSSYRQGFDISIPLFNRPLVVPQMILPSR